MKNTIIASLVVIGISIGACSKSDDKSAIEAEKLKASLSSGVWKIVSLIEDGDDYSLNFKDYRLQFQSNGQLVASQDSSQYNGFWKLDTEDDKDHHHHSKHAVELELFFTNQSLLKKLNEDWRLYDQSETRITLSHYDSKDQEILILEKD